MLSAVVQPERAARPVETILDGSAANIWRALRDAFNRSREAVTSARIARALTAARLHDPGRPGSEPGRVRCPLARSEADAWLRPLAKVAKKLATAGAAPADQPPGSAPAEFKLAPLLPDLGASETRFVRLCTTPCWLILPTFCPTNDQRPDRRDSDQALDLLLHS